MDEEDNVKNIGSVTVKKVQIDVPHDHNCLFWTASLAYLLPVIKNPAEFKERLRNP